MHRPDLSIIMGSLNRKSLLKQTIKSIRTNGYSGNIEIIVVDGGSVDGTCDWLAKQKDILTIIQPNYKIVHADGTLRRAHTWGEFINIGFRAASAPWILMVSDDLLLCRGAIQAGLDELNSRLAKGEKIGGGALFWREYPRDKKYHVKLLPNKFLLINHGFFYKKALEEVGYINETDFEFYGADGDLAMRLNLAGWTTIPLQGAFAEHLFHRTKVLPWLVGKRVNPRVVADMGKFHGKYQEYDYSEKEICTDWIDADQAARIFWKLDFYACLEGTLRRYLF